jgi:hypothetical protein
MPEMMPPGSPRLPSPRTAAPSTVLAACIEALEQLVLDVGVTRRRPLAERKLNADIALAEKKLSLDRAFAG